MRQIYAEPTASECMELPSRELQRITRLCDNAGLAVRGAVSRMRRSGVPWWCEFEDLVQCAWIGLIEAVKRYRPMGPDGEARRLSTYATPLIFGSTIEGLDYDAAAFRFRRAHEPFPKIAPTDFCADFDDTGMSDMYSHDSSAVVRREAERKRMESEDLDSVQAEHDVTSLYRQLMGLVKRLKPREQEILRLHYWENLPLEEVAPFIGLTRERVRQIETMALKKLRAWAKHDPVLVNELIERAA